MASDSLKGAQHTLTNRLPPPWQKKRPQLVNMCCSGYFAAIPFCFAQWWALAVFLFCLVVGSCYGWLMLCPFFPPRTSCVHVCCMALFLLLPPCRAYVAARIWLMFCLFFPLRTSCVHVCCMALFFFTPAVSCLCCCPNLANVLLFLSAANTVCSFISKINKNQ